MSKPRYRWWGYVKAVVRDYPDKSTAKEREAVVEAIKETEQLPSAMERMAIIEMVFWKKTHTLAGAALKANCSYDTAINYHGDFIRLVAQKIGLLD